MAWTKENHPTNGGRKVGSRNRLAKHVFEDLIEIWNEPISPGSEIRRGPAALRIIANKILAILRSSMHR